MDEWWYLQARVEEVGQALLRRTQDAGGVGPRRKGKRSRFHMDAYEEHMLLPEVHPYSSLSPNWHNPNPNTLASVSPP